MPAAREARSARLILRGTSYSEAVPRLVPLPVPAGPSCLRIVPALRAALAGSGPAVAPHAAEDAPLDLPPYVESDLPDDFAVVVGTSGSTGPPKLALLGAAALAASADATAARLGGRGDWLLALPAHHIAGLQVLLRAAAWDTRVRVLPAGPFRAEAFTAAAAALHDETPAAGSSAPGYVSLVPTQLGRLLDDAPATAELSRFAAVLVGGAACPPELLTRAAAAGVRVVTTYGSSETCGGCVYDGVPLDCADVVVERPDETGIGRLLLGGPMLAAGYLGDPARSAAAFPTYDGRRVFRTDDLGRISTQVTVLGRADDVIVTGALKVLPGQVEDAIRAALPGWDVTVVGVPDPDWGHVVAAALAPADPEHQPRTPPTLEQLRDAVRPALPAYALPRALLVLPALPLLGIGKPDRAAVRAAFAARA